MAGAARTVGWSAQVTKRPKSITINGTLATRDWQKFKLHVWLESDQCTWLVTHAGFHRSWLENVRPGRYREFIDTVCADAWNCLNRGEHHFLLGRGASRSGDQLIGGINWMDWDELVPIPGFNQLTGHTQGDAVRYNNTVGSRNICLDTGLRHYAVFADGQFEIKSYKDLIAP